MLPEWGRETEEGVRQIMTSGVTSAAAERLQSSSQEGKEENVCTLAAVFFTFVTARMLVRLLRV